MECEKLNSSQRKMVEENHNLIYSFINSRNLSVEDWYDVFAISLCKAAKTYSDSDTKFSTYAYCVMLNDLRCEIRNSLSSRRKINSETLSYDNEIKCDDAESVFAYFIPDMSLDIELEAIINMSYEKCLSKLNDRQLLIAKLLRYGYKTKEICNIVGCSHQTVFNVKKYIKRSIT